MIVFATGFALLLAASQGEVYVARGDTLVISGTPIRLHGIERPQNSRKEAETARQQMQRIIEGSFVTCGISDKRIGHQRIGTCTANGEDIAAAMVASGHALDCERFSEGRYRALEPKGARSRLVPSQQCEK
ncbi:thermonuclease family protein [Aliiruegeria lutimaris]|uniref:Nuclease homologue n=1 Tax=Aliiruegeria lutimaris TaxID=571298 RepID=A0A1G8SJD1_9RHOB|nr:hypothetical protein [Aliiruegeria lutimaris]SDJ29358.1 hypothetical protein SAMN04488026_101529 [Aliiruegeria lutimaris]